MVKSTAMVDRSTDKYHILQTLVLTLDNLHFKSAGGSEGRGNTSNHFVTEVDANSDGSALFFSVSDDSVQLVDTSTNVVTSRFQAHASTITCVSCASQHPQQFVTAAYDRSVKLWDARAPEAVQTFRFPVEPLATTTLFGDTLLAASQENAIHFIDIRQQQKVGIYDDCHTDTVTQLKRSPVQDGMLASAADDCLICCYDVTTAQQQDAVISILNTECPIARIGFFGNSYEGIYCLSGVETMNLWHYPSAQRINSFENIRNNDAWPVSVDYLVDCIYTPESDMLKLYAGAHDGQMVECEVSPADVRPVKTMSSGHRSTVRCVASSNRRVYTGGEDARVCIWTEERPAQMNLTPSSTHPVPRKTAKDRQFRPYGMPKQRKKQL